MPIDIAGGIFHRELPEVHVPGKYDLRWGRNYSTAAARRDGSALGRGWTNQYFCALAYADDSYHFQGPNGAVEALYDPEQRVEWGQLVVNFGAFLDLHVRRDEYVVRHWNVDTGEVTHYVFARMPVGETCPLRAIERPTGQGLDLEYDARGRLVRITQRLERRRLVLGYDEDGRVGEVVFEPSPAETYVRARYRYDAAGRLTAAADPGGFEDYYEYDAAGRMTREVVKDGGVFTMRYDRSGRCVYMSGRDRYDEKRLRFLDAAGWVEVTDSTGAVWRYNRRSTGQITETIDPLGAVRATTYDDHDRIAAVVDETGARTSFAYDAQGNRAGITTPVGHAFRLTYTDARLPARLLDAAGRVWERQYDSAHRLIATSDPAGAVWNYGYDADGNLTRVIDPAGAEKMLSFDAGVLVEASDWEGNASAYRHDAFGRLVERVDPLGFATRLVYDLWGNLVAQHSPDGSARRAEYDAAGNMIRYVDANGAATTYVYGPCGLLQAAVAPDGAATRYVWSTEPERLIAIYNERGETYRFTRDDAGNVVEEVGFDGRRVRFRYDGAGRRIGVTNDGGDVLVLERDAVGRVVRRVLSDGSVTTFTFDALGAMSSASNAHVALRFERDQAGRLVREVQGEHWVGSTYDAAGHLVRTETDLGLVVEYTVDANGGVRRVVCGGGDVRVVRDARGVETGRGLFDAAELKLQHDPVGRLTGQQLSLGGRGAPGAGPARVVALRRAYDYTANGMLRAVADDAWGTRAYQYDVRDRLVEVTATAEVVERFDYDATNNLMAIVSRPGVEPARVLAYDPGDRLRRAGGITFRFDSDGRLAAKGRNTSDGFRPEWTFSWNAADELVRMTRPNGEAWAYAYDPLGRRIAKHRDGTRAATFVWDRDRLVHEITDGSVVSWVFEQENLAPVLRVDAIGVSAVVCDHLGTPIAFADAGGVTRADRLSAWGIVDEPARPRGRTNLRFQGQYFDAESGLHYSRFRYYAPDVGRFVSQDPISLEGGFNLYRYGINPTSFVDPYGLSTSSDSQKLGNNLINDAGQSPLGSNEDAHHVVMSNSADPRMSDLRGVMSGHGIDLNDPRNGIWLPRTDADRQAGDTRTVHKGEGLHSDAYKQYVYDRLMAGAPPPPTKQQFLARLRAIKQQLAQGKTFPCK